MCRSLLACTLLHPACSMAAWRTLAAAPTCQAQASTADVSHRGAAHHPHDLSCAAAIIRHGQHMCYARRQLPHVPSYAVEGRAPAENHKGGLRRHLLPRLQVCCSGCSCGGAAQEAAAAEGLRRQHGHAQKAEQVALHVAICRWAARSG
jgi:hypothetical protein